MNTESPSSTLTQNDYRGCCKVDFRSGYFPAVTPSSTLRAYSCKYDLVGTSLAPPDLAPFLSRYGCASGNLCGPRLLHVLVLAYLLKFLVHLRSARVCCGYDCPKVPSELCLHGDHSRTNTKMRCTSAIIKQNLILAHGRPARQEWSQLLKG